MNPRLDATTPASTRMPVSTVFASGSLAGNAGSPAIRPADPGISRRPYSDFAAGACRSSERMNSDASPGAATFLSSRMSRREVFAP